MNSEVLDQYVTRLIEEKNFINLDAEVMEQIKQDLANSVEDRINATILANLPPEKLEEFESLLTSETPDDTIQQFCEANIPDLNEVLAAALMDFRRTYLGQ